MRRQNRPSRPFSPSTRRVKVSGCLVRGSCTSPEACEGIFRQGRADPGESLSLPGAAPVDDCAHGELNMSMIVSRLALWCK